LQILFFGVQPFSGKFLMHTRVILKFGEKVLVNRVLTKSVSWNILQLKTCGFLYHQIDLFSTPPQQQQHPTTQSAWSRPTSSINGTSSVPACQQLDIQVNIKHQTAEKKRRLSQHQIKVAYVDTNTNKAKNINNIRQHISHDGNKDVDWNGLW
jgi:hypothetical protein